MPSAHRHLRCMRTARPVTMSMGAPPADLGNGTARALYIWPCRRVVSAADVSPRELQEPPLGVTGIGAEALGLSLRLRPLRPASGLHQVSTHRL